MTSIPELSNPQRRALDLVKEVAIEKACRPFLVGGPVRDILLGRTSFDIDLTLEDGSSTLARAIAKRLDGRVRSFPQFLTYKVTADGFPEIDIATARKERYRKPGDLPSVAAGRLKDDLLRRDFSINAIAMDLMNGALHDPANGERDLSDRVVRVLHDQSFLDDPTRILRAVRLGTRLGFLRDAHTDKLMRDAIAADALATVSRERIWRELFLAFAEEAAPAILAELNERGVLEKFFGQRVDANAIARLSALQSQIDGNNDVDRDVLFTGALLPAATAQAELEGSGFSLKRAKRVLQIANDTQRFADALADAKSDRQRFRLFKQSSPELLSVIAVERPQEREHIDRYHAFRNFKLALRGNELEVPPGPHVARALERTREAVFTGEVAADDAREFARDLAKQFLNS
ncbi:MAG TPA: hypothetical protein VMU84_07570 [Thermoanaerobaculia bacterium]|nr:hypothetical protein [Thermoanaerobaculia bacterium]